MADVSAKLPEEILVQVLPDFGLGRGESAWTAGLAVSRRWRAVAWNHPSYWSDVDFQMSRGPRTVHLGAIRLTRSGNRPFRLSLWMPGVRSGDRVRLFREIVLPLVTEHLHRIHTLRVMHIPLDLLHDLLASITVPAAVLTSFTLTVDTSADSGRFSDHYSFSTLPHDLFAGRPALLRHLVLKNVGHFLQPVLASHQRPTWCSEIDKLSLEYHTMLPRVLNWKDSMPRVRVLDIHSKDNFLEAGSRIDLDRINLYIAAIDPVHHPIAQVSIVHAYVPSNQLNYALLSHLGDDGDLVMSLGWADTADAEFTVTFSPSHQPQLQRVFHGALEVWRAAWPYDKSHPAAGNYWTSRNIGMATHGLFTQHETFQRVVIFQAPITLLAALAHHLPRCLPGLQEVVLFVTAEPGWPVWGDCQLARHRVPIDCPTLKHVVIKDVYQCRRLRLLDEPATRSLLEHLFTPPPLVTLENMIFDFPN
ncbi:hypothetical protein BKA62DRAFT_717427 [Auriculariales sp. MPI-PUGE-AT-0066]|nr:hypothetical protein BKA62DRAFT_717427 [Auriculariales sp. MPI-PUGE-AT-0066]